jgi:hypothetical protein
MNPSQSISSSGLRLCGCEDHEQQILLLPDCAVPNGRAVGAGDFEGRNRIMRAQHAASLRDFKDEEVLIRQERVFRGQAEAVRGHLPD